MQLSDYNPLPDSLPIVVEDELFLYPFMISPIFLSNAKDIEASSDAMKNNSLLFCDCVYYRQRRWARTSRLSYKVVRRDEVHMHEKYTDTPDGEPEDSFKGLCSVVKYFNAESTLTLLCSRYCKTESWVISL
ncbi:MAG: hypothetical protein Q9M36_04870 [Sulfurovum sp.]|nr:hypothetical protein [Sulfurovum sp.]